MTFANTSYIQRSSKNGPNFWKQPIRIGDDLRGIYTSLTLMEMGQGKAGTASRFVNPVSEDVTSEKNETMLKEHTWTDKSIKDFDEHSDENLCSKFPNLKQEKAVGRFKVAKVACESGPSLNINEMELKWISGSEAPGMVDKKLEQRLFFWGKAGEKVYESINISNTGTTTVYFSWKRVFMPPKFGIVPYLPKRWFYFNAGDGAILSGKEINFEFCFKSMKPGIFMEKWEFHTFPKLCDGIPVVFTLKGIATEEDLFYERRLAINKQLEHVKAQEIVKEVIEMILIRSLSTEIPRILPSEPVTVSLEEKFLAQNSSYFFYKYEHVAKLQKMYTEITGGEWDFSIKTLKQSFRQLEEEQQERYRVAMYETLSKMIFKDIEPLKQNRYRLFYHLLTEMIDNFVQRSCLIRKMMRLPSKDDVTDDQPDSLFVKKKSLKKEGKRISPKERSKSRSSAKALSGPSSLWKKGGAVKFAASLSLKPSSITHHSSDPAPVVMDLILEREYQEKLYVQTYQLLCNMFDKMSTLYDYTKI